MLWCESWRPIQFGAFPAVDLLLRVKATGHNIGVGRFRILGGQGLEYWGGQGLEYLGRGARGANSQQAHDVDAT